MTSGGVTWPKSHLTVTELRQESTILLVLVVMGCVGEGGQGVEGTDVPWDIVSKPEIFKVKCWHGSC